MKLYRSCTGCYESEDGHPVGDYPIHPRHNCYIGSGCRECQGRGFIRDHSAEYVIDNYEQIIREMNEQQRRDKTAKMERIERLTREGRLSQSYIGR